MIVINIGPLLFTTWIKSWTILTRFKIRAVNLIACKYTLSIITSQLHCFQLRATLNGKDFKFFLMGYAEKQNILLQHMREKKILFWSINMGKSINTKTRLQVMTWSLVFVLKLISTFISQNKEFFFLHVLKKDVLLLCAYTMRKKL
jgi:hypothetical protein